MSSFVCSFWNLIFSRARLLSKTLGICNFQVSHSSRILPAGDEFQRVSSVRFMCTTFKDLKFCFKVTTFATSKRFLSNFLFEMGKSKLWILLILATSRALMGLGQKTKWICSLKVQGTYHPPSSTAAIHYIHFVCISNETRVTRL